MRDSGAGDTSHLSRMIPACPASIIFDVRPTGQPETAAPALSLAPRALPPARHLRHDPALDAEGRGTDGEEGPWPGYS